MGGYLPNKAYTETMERFRTNMANELGVDIFEGIPTQNGSLFITPEAAAELPPGLESHLHNTDVITSQVDLTEHFRATQQQKLDLDLLKPPEKNLEETLHEPVEEAVIINTPEELDNAIISSITSYMEAGHAAAFPIGLKGNIELQSRQRL